MRVLFVLAAILIFASCSRQGEELHLLEGLPIATGATEVQRFQLRSPDTQQLYFQLEREYPARDVLDGYATHFAGKNWTRCRGGVGWSDGWQSYIDEATEPARRIHRITSLWIAPDNQTFAVVNGSYSSALTTYSSPPDNSTQRWVILLQAGVDAAAEAKRLSFSCEPK